MYQTVVSRLLKKHREDDSVKESKRSACILECKGLSLKRHGMLCIFSRPHAAVKGSKQNLNSQKYRDELLESDVTSVGEERANLSAVVYL